jgi:serine phosphatase RsbU (regulator of sigma subunit)
MTSRKPTKNKLRSEKKFIVLSTFKRYLPRQFMHFRVISYVLIIFGFCGFLYGQSVDTYVNLRSGKSYAIGDEIQIGKGTNPDGSFKFLSWKSALVGSFDAAPLSPGYAGTKTAFTSFKLTGNKKAGQLSTAVLKLSGNTGYNCVAELDNAFRFGELVPVGTPLFANKGETKVEEKIIYKEVPVKGADEMIRKNKRMNEELNRSQRELDSLKLTGNFQDKQLKEKEMEIRMRQLEAERRADEIRKLSEDTTVRGQELIEKLEAIRQMEYQNQLIQNQLELERKEIQLREGELEKQRLVRNSLIGGITFILFVAILLLFLFRANRRINRELSRTNAEILLQKEELEKRQLEIAVKNRQITDSISYAKRIQDASLPGIDNISGRFTKSLLYFRPRDIVSGDFYWFYENDRYQVAAVVDCTGHGVPGAFMSLIGSNLLAETVEVQQTFEPGKILSRVNERVQQVLKQTGDRKDPRDGMDMIILVIDRHQNKVFYSGANRPLLHIRNQNIEVIRTNKVSIGGFNEDVKVFNEFHMPLVKGDSFILFTDGLPDQMGGEKRRKLSTRILTQWIHETMQLPDDQRHKEFDKRMREWQGSQRQLDDMLLWALTV